MFRYISKNTLNSSRQITICINNLRSYSFHNQNDFINKKPYNSEITIHKSQKSRFAFGKWNLNRFNKDMNRYTLKDFTKNQLVKKVIENRKDEFKKYIKINKLSSTIQLDKNKRKIKFNPVFSPNKTKLNKVIRKNLIGRMNKAEEQDQMSMEDRIFLTDMNSQALENLRKIKENKIFNKKIHEIHERKIAIKLESRKLENLIENFDFKFKNFENYSDTEGNTFKNYTLLDFIPLGKMTFGANLEEKNPLKSLKYESPYKIQTKFNEYVEYKKQLQNIRIESLLSTKKSNPHLNKYLYLNIAEENSSKFLLDENEKRKKIEEIKVNETIINSEDKKYDENFKNTSHGNLKMIDLNEGKDGKKNDFLIDSDLNKQMNPMDNILMLNDDITNLFKNKTKINQPNNDQQEKNIELYFKKHIDLKLRIDNYETELYNEYRNLDIYNKFGKGITKFIDLSIEENLNYIKFNLTNTHDLFKMFIEVKNVTNPKIFSAMIQKLAISIKTDKELERTLNLYEYKDLLREVKKDFKNLDNKNFVDTIWAIGKIHKTKRDFSQKFFQHLLNELFDEANLRAETFKIEEIAFLCQGISLLNPNEFNDDLMIVSKKNELLEKLFKYLINTSSIANIPLKGNLGKFITLDEEVNNFAFIGNTPIGKLKYFHHASSILKCFDTYSNNLTNKEYVELLNYFSISIMHIIYEKNIELIDEVDLRDLKNLMNCYSSGLTKLRLHNGIDIQEESKNEDLLFNSGNLVRKLNNNFDILLNEKEFINKLKADPKKKIEKKFDEIFNKNKIEENLKIEDEEEENQLKQREVLEKNLEVLKDSFHNKNINILEKPKSNFLQVMNFLISAMLFKLNKLEIKDTSEIMFAINNAKLFDYSTFINKIRKKTVDELDKGKPVTLTQLKKYFWGLAQYNNKIFSPEFNFDINGLIYPRLTKRIKTSSFVEINKVKNSIFEMKNLVENKDLSLFLYSISSMGYSDPEFFIPMLNNLVQYDKMNFLNMIEIQRQQKNNDKSFVFKIKDLGYYFNTLAFLNYNDEQMMKFFLNKLLNCFEKKEKSINYSAAYSSIDNSIRQNDILVSNKNNDMAISMILVSLVHLNSKIFLRNIRNWQNIIDSIIHYCRTNYTSKNAKNIISLLWFLNYMDYFDENLYSHFLNLVFENFSYLSKFDKVILNQCLLLIFRNYDYAFKSNKIGVDEIKILNNYSMEFEKSRRCLQEKFASSNYENESNSELVKKCFENNKNYLIKNGISFEKDYIVEYSYTSDIFIKQRKILIDVYDHYEILKNKSLNGYNEMKENIYEKLGYKILRIYTNDYEFIIAKEDEEKLFDYILNKMNMIK